MHLKLADTEQPLCRDAGHVNAAVTAALVLGLCWESSHTEELLLQIVSWFQNRKKSFLACSSGFTFVYS